MISIIIPVHDGEATIAHCLQSIMDSSFKDYEVIVVDDGSCDSTIDIVKTFTCQLYSLETAKGAATARNFGASRAKGKILFFTDSDIIIKRDTLEKVCDVLTATSEYQAVIVPIQNIPGSLISFPGSKIIAIILLIKNHTKKRSHSGLDAAPYIVMFF